jgi:ubiquinone/menaquinone biosynthesis C-methylase UbiE
LQGRGLAVFGLDESAQMARQANRRLRRRGFVPAITRGYAQAVPFPGNSFDSVVATFPSEYFFEEQTLAEAWRVLVPGGRLVVLPMAWINGKGLHDRLVAWLFQVTGQARAIEAILPDQLKRIRASGFEVRHELEELPSSRVLVIVATKGR